MFINALDHYGHTRPWILWRYFHILGHFPSYLGGVWSIFHWPIVKYYFFQYRGQSLIYLLYCLGEFASLWIQFCSLELNLPVLFHVGCWEAYLADLNILRGLLTSLIILLMQLQFHELTVYICKYQICIIIKNIDLNPGLTWWVSYCLLLSKFQLFCVLLIMNYQTSYLILFWF